MTTFLLIRHGENDFMHNALPGRLPGVHLNEEGRRQAARLAERLAQAPIAAILSSPLERARETAEPLARRLNLDILVSERLSEIAYGEWTGRSWAELKDNPLWQHYNSFRSETRIPGGELMLEAQARIVAEMEGLLAKYPGSLVALFGHGDVIKAALLYYSGIPIDLFRRLEVGPASVSVLQVTDETPRLLRVNDTGDLAALWASVQ